MTPGSFLRRIIAMVPLLLAVTLGAFLLVRLAPGGPFDSERAASSEEARAAVRARYHLDEPLPAQYWRFLSNLVRGDLGPSLKYRHHTVNDILAQALPVSMALGSAAFLVAMGLGIPLGICSALWKTDARGRIIDLLTLISISIPGLILGPMLVLIFAIGLKWFPVGLFESPWHAILPVLTLGIYFAGRVARLMREGTLGVLGSDFVLAARARGVGSFRLIWRHVFPLAVTPVLSYAGPLLADLLTGSFVVENVFQVPGIGIFMVNSSLNRDYTMVVGLVLVYATLLLVLNLLVDLLYAVIDPRVRHG